MYTVRDAESVPRILIIKENGHHDEGVDVVKCKDCRDSDVREGEMRYSKNPRRR